MRVKTSNRSMCEIRHLPRGIEVMLLAEVNFSSCLESFVVEGVLTLVSSFVTNPLEVSE